VPESASSAVDFASGPPSPVSLDVAWDHGSRRRGEGAGPPIQVHAADPHTFILRQSKSVHYEAPFLYLLCGNERALLLDTGATSNPADFPLRATVDAILEGWLAEHPRQHYELVVAHSHGHGDHVAADGQLADRPDTTVVAPDLPSVQAFFGFTTWPQEVVRLDLGGRVLEVTGCPGHHPASIAVLDPWSGFLLTGDTVYPGRLYVDDMPSYVASLDRLADLAGSRRVTAVMGCHIEMSRMPGRDYPRGSTWQPDEAPLPMSVDQLAAVRDAARAVADRPGAHVRDDVIIFNGPCRAAMARQTLRLWWSTLRRRMP
jgi:hydroxyacylglutathione hydrolase